MRKVISSIAAAVVCSFSVQAFAFNDTGASAILNDSIKQLQELCIINGYPDGGFHPNKEITRAETAKIAIRLLQKDVNIGGSEFGFAQYNDVDTNHWAYTEIRKISSLNIMNGYEDGSFQPSAPVTYQEMLKIIVNMLNYGEEAERAGGYPDGYISVAEKLNITRNVAFFPTDKATRAGIAIIVCNSLDIPCRIISSYTVGGDASYEIDTNITFRSIIAAEN